MRAPAVMLVVVACAALTPAVPAQAAPLPTGPLCTFYGVSHVGGSLRGNGVVAGGPVLVRDPSRPTTVLTGAALTCTLQIGGRTHDAPDTVAVTGIASLPPIPTTMASVVEVVASPVEYPAPVSYTAKLCTSVRIGATTLYWTPTDTGGRWTTDSGSECGHVNFVEVGSDIRLDVHPQDVAG